MHQPAPQHRMETPAEATADNGAAKHWEQELVVLVTAHSGRTGRHRKDRGEVKGGLSLSQQGGDRNRDRALWMTGLNRGPVIDPGAVPRRSRRNGHTRCALQTGQGTGRAAVLQRGPLDRCPQHPLLKIAALLRCDHPLLLKRLKVGGRLRENTAVKQHDRQQPNQSEHACRRPVQIDCRVGSPQVSHPQRRRQRVVCFKRRHNPPSGLSPSILQTTPSVGSIHTSLQRRC